MKKKEEKKKSSPPKKKTSLGPSPKGGAGWYFFIFLISVWMFVLGVLVGRGTAPVQFDIEALQKELAALKKAQIQEEQERLKLGSDPVVKEPDLEFYEALKDTKNVGLLPSRVSKSREKPSTDKTGAVKKKTGALKKARPTKTPSAKRTAPSATARASRKKLTIQVASLKDAQAADKMVDKYKKKGYPAYRVTGKVSGKGVWYRVRIGYYENRTDAESTLNRLKREKVKAILVNR